MNEPFDPDRIAGAGRVRIPDGPLTVSQVTAMVKRAIETALPAMLHVVGQISNAKRHSSGHLYFTLKDNASEISCVMWRSDAARLKFKPDDGLEVVAAGAVEIFERAGRYQLYVRRLEPRGVGTLELAFRQLCEKLRGEGLFDPRHKQPLPRVPRCIAIVTSPTGAAVADMLRTVRRKFPCVEVLLYPVRVQGDGAAGEIAAAVRGLNRQRDRLGGIDVMIVGRGGGSIEDLWAFNEEAVARAVFASEIPIISGVGHETDLTVCDLVADARAPTPTAAAEMAVPDRNDLLTGIDGLAARMSRAADGNRDLGTARLNGLLHRRPFREPLTVVRHRGQIVDESAGRMQRRLVHRLSATRARLDAAEALLQRIAPHAYLLRTSRRLRDASERLRWAMSRRLGVADRRLGVFIERLVRRPAIARLDRSRLRLGRISDKMPAALNHRVSMGKARAESLETLLHAVSHESVLSRGFSITRTKKGRRLIRSAADVHDGERIVTQTVGGTFESDVVNQRQLELFE